METTGSAETVVLFQDDDKVLVKDKLYINIVKYKTLESDNKEYISIIRDLLTLAPDINKKQWVDIHTRYMGVEINKHKPSKQD